ncbi:MAG: M23 family metallopeptidase [archaeon]
MGAIEGALEGAAVAAETRAPGADGLGQQLQADKDQQSQQQGQENTQEEKDQRGRQAAKAGFVGAAGGYLLNKVMNPSQKEGGSAGNWLILFGFIIHYFYSTLGFNPLAYYRYDIFIAFLVYVMSLKGLQRDGVKGKLAAASPVAIVLALSWGVQYAIGYVFPGAAATYLGSKMLNPVWWPWWALLGIWYNESRLSNFLKGCHGILILWWILGVASPAFGIEALNRDRAALVEQTSEGDTLSWKEKWNCLVSPIKAPGQYGERIESYEECIQRKLGSDNEAADPLSGSIDLLLKEEVTLSLQPEKQMRVSDNELHVTSVAYLSATSTERDIKMAVQCGLEDAPALGEPNPSEVTVRKIETSGHIESISCDLSGASFKPGYNRVLFSAEIGEGMLSSRAIIWNYFIPAGDEDAGLIGLENRFLNDNPDAKQSFYDTVRAKGLLEAKLELYKNMFAEQIRNDYPTMNIESKSSPGFINLIIETEQLPIIGLNDGTTINLNLAVVNTQMGGTILDITDGTVELPEFLVPKKGGCEILTGVQHPKYRITRDYLRSIDWRDVKPGKASQKRMSTCTLAYNGSVPLPERNDLNPRMFRFEVAYNYKVTAEGSVYAEAPAIGGPYAGGITYPLAGGAGQPQKDFGNDRPNERDHEGNDLMAPAGTDVLAAAAGTVINMGCNQLGGNRIGITDENGVYYYYAHLSAYNVKLNDKVRAGQVIGKVGTTIGCQGACVDDKWNKECNDRCPNRLCGIAGQTAPHLHFAVYVNDMARDQYTALKAAKEAGATA